MLSILFDARSYGPKVMQNIFSTTKLNSILAFFYSTQVSKRYFVAGVHQLDVDLHKNTEEPRELALTETIPLDASGNDPLGKVNTLLSIARSGSSRDPPPTQTQPDFLSLEDQEESHAIEYEVNDRTPGHGNASPILVDQDCPAMLEDMLFIVRNLRDDRLMRMAHATPTSPQRTESARSMQLVTPAQADRESAKSRASSFVYTNADDFDCE